MTTPDIPRLRLQNQRIAGPKFAAPGEVVRWMGAMQAQDYNQAVWAIGARMEQPTLAGVEEAIEEGKILRTWPMRGTIHFVPPEDAGWMLKLSASRMLAADKRRQEQLELNETILERCKELFHDALSVGKRLSRPDMMQLLEDAGISTKGGRGYHILWYASQTGLICLGPMQGKQQTFVLLDEWVPRSRELSREESLAELVGRYFASHGPATIYDFAWWAGLKVTEAKAGLEAVRSKLTAEKVGGKEYWMPEDDPAQPSPDECSVYLLPGFDEYLLGYKDRSTVLAPEHASKVVPGGNGVFFPIIVIGGQVAGTWKRTLKKKSLDVTLNPFSPLGDLERKAIEAARSYGAFIGLPLEEKAG